MLIFKDTIFFPAPFKDEDELEQVVVSNYEYIFGPTSIYLPKKMIRTGDGTGTITDGFAIDLKARKWYLVEAELLHHNVWKHIAPQVSKQVIASLQDISKKVIEDLAVEQYQNDPTTKEKFSEQGIKEINIRRVLADILRKEPSVGIPINAISNDLNEWAKTLKYSVKLWKITKYVEFNQPDNIVYEFPEEFSPEVDTEAEKEGDSAGGEITRYEVTVADLIEADLMEVGQTLIMEYKPRHGKKKKYQGVINEDGSLTVLEQLYSSLSHAALVGIKDAGSDRKTVNGWTSWKTIDGETIADIREKYLKQIETR